MADPKSIRKHPLYRAFLWIALVISLVILLKLNASVLSNPVYIPVDDFTHYWAAGKLVISGDDPYDPNLVNQARIDITGSQPKFDTIPIMYTPPWSLPVVMPFGMLEYANARLLWLIVHVALLLLSANLIWKIYYRDSKLVAVAWVITLVFGPTISVLEKGQITPWVLAGIALFLIFNEVRPNLFLAGFAVWLISLKPQLFYLFWPALLFWVIAERKWRLLLGTLAGVAAALIIPMLFDPQLLSQYVNAILNYPPIDWATPTIGGYLRILLGPEKFWLQFIPPVLGFAWFIYYWNIHRSQWVWSKTLPDLLLVSILTAAYSWTYDQVILVPVMLVAGARLIQYPRDRRAVFLAFIFILISLLDLFLHRSLDEFWFGWLAPSLMIWYYAVMRLLPARESPGQPNLENELT